MSREFASVSEVVLIDAENIFSLTRRKCLESRREFGEGQRLFAPAEAERFSALSRAGVKVDALRLKAKPGSDAQRNVVDGELGDTSDVTNCLIDNGVKGLEGLSSFELVAAPTKALRKPSASTLISTSPAASSRSSASCSHRIGIGVPAGERVVATVTSSSPTAMTVFGRPLTVVIVRPIKGVRTSRASIAAFRYTLRSLMST